MRISPVILIDEREIQEDFILASGPGGQNINKVATGVQLRFDAAHSPSLPEQVRKRLISLAGKRITSDGVLVIESKGFRSQRRNRQEARRKLFDLIDRAAEEPKKRRRTRPSSESRERRLANKHMRGERKKMRRRITGIDLD